MQVTFGSKNVFEELNDPQLALIKAVNSPQYSSICAALSRRLGKTFIANVIGQLITLVPGSDVLIMSPNFTLSSISFELQRRLIRHFEIEVAKDNTKDRIIELENGSTIRMGSVTTVDSCVGRSYNLIIFDEAALGDGRDAFNISLRPTLDRPGSKAIFISTPRGKNNWFAEFWNRGFDPMYKEWISLQADYTENKRMSDDDVDEARRTMSKAEFEQEYMASFVSFEGQIYSLNEKCIVEYDDYSDGIECFAGIDPGFKDPTAMCVIKYSPETGIYHIIDEYQENKATTRDHAERIKELVLLHSIDSIFIDSAAAQFAGDLAYMYDITTIKGKKQVLEGIAFVQTLVEQDLIRVSPHCTHTLAMFDQYQWDTRDTLKQEKPKHDPFSHMADAVRYAIYSFIV